MEALFRTTSRTRQIFSGFCQKINARSFHDNKDYYRSRYHKVYVSPLKNKQDLNKPLADDDPLKFFPIQASETNATPHLFKDELIEKLTNMVMQGGQKHKAREIVGKTLVKIKHHQVNLYWSTESEEERANIELDPTKIIYKAVENATPILHLTPFTRGGVTYQVPTPVHPKFARFMALKWFVRICRDRKLNRLMHNLLAEEFLGAYNKEGRVMQAKYDLHKICEANRAYSHYRQS